MLDLSLSLEAVAAQGGGGASPPDLLLDYENSSYKLGGVTTTDESTLTGRAFSRTGVTTKERNAANNGFISFVGTAPRIVPGVGLYSRSAATNTFVNPETPATQNITVTAVAQTLSFYGTGTITLSGVSTAGPLVGTGANDLVSLTFTPTAGTLTLTVSGSVAEASLVAGAFAGPRFIATGAAGTDTMLPAASYALANTDCVLLVVGAIAAATNATLAAFNDTTANNEILMYRPSTGFLATNVAAGGVSQNVGAQFHEISATERVAVALRLKSGKLTRFTASDEGAVFMGLEGTSASLPAATRVIAGRANSVATLLNGYVQVIGRYPGAYTNEQVKDLIQGRMAAVGKSISAAVLGDSTAAYYLTIHKAVSYYIPGLGHTLLATAGETITQQKARWDAMTDRSGLDAVIIAGVGHNDCAVAAVTPATIITRYQGLVDDINATKPVGCKVYIAQMTPAKASQSANAYAAWQGVNEAIAGAGATPIIDVDGRITAHVALLSDGADNLDAAYDIGDGIHENNAGRAIFGDAIRDVLVSDGLLN